MSRALPVHQRSIIVDGHCDTPYRLKRRSSHIDEPDPTAQVSLQTLQESGITASFFAAYVPPFYAGRGAAKFAHSLIDIIETEVARNSGALELVTDSTGIRQVKARGEVGLMIGVEGGHAIEDSLEILSDLYGRGARYLTLTHVNTNNWADSSGGEARHGGLTSFGREVVSAMNRMGMIVDISHVADTTFYQALEASSVPVIASHSSCRKLASHPRNLTDDMLKDLASAGGVCMINFFSAFINDDAARAMLQAGKRSSGRKTASEFEELPDDRIDWDSFVTWFGALGAPSGTLDQVADHIVHAASVAGVQSVGIGSDFDGVPMLPEGLENASCLPFLTARLLERGFQAEEIELILGGNFMRVFESVERGKR
ncbi:MAG: dipeptidase [Acidobacteriota bacterium]